MAQKVSSNQDRREFVELAGETLPKPTLLEELRARIPNAPSIKPLPEQSLVDICTDLRTDIHGLESSLKTQMGEFAKDVSKACSLDLDYIPLVGTIYQLYRLGQVDSTLQNQLPWIKTLSNFDSFAEHFCPQASPHSKAWIAKTVEAYISWCVHPERCLSVAPRSFSYEGYDPFTIAEYRGEWKLIPSMFGTEGAYDFIERGVLEEIVGLLKQHNQPPAFTHETGSAALEGIAQEGAILSARSAKERNVKVKTGEFSSYVNSDNGHSVSGGEDGLRDVFVSRGYPSAFCGYSVIRWFNEHPIGFGIVQEAQEKYLDDLNRTKELHGEDRLMIVDRHSEGETIGPQVPLANVRCIYCLYSRKLEMQEWASRHCPQAKIVSFEAVRCMNLFKPTINYIAVQERVGLADAWQQVADLPNS